MIPYSKTRKNKKNEGNSSIFDIADKTTPQNSSSFSDNRCFLDKTKFTRELWTICKKVYNSYNELQLKINICTKKRLQCVDVAVVQYGFTTKLCHITNILTENIQLRLCLHPITSKLSRVDQQFP